MKRTKRDPKSKSGGSVNVLLTGYDLDLLDRAADKVMDGNRSMFARIAIREKAAREGVR